MIDKNEKKEVEYKIINCSEFQHKEFFENEEINNSDIKRLDKENLTSSEFNEEKSGINLNYISSFQLEQKSDFLFLTENKNSFKLFKC